MKRRDALTHLGFFGTAALGGAGRLLAKDSDTGAMASPDSQSDHLYTTPPMTWAPLYEFPPHSFFSWTGYTVVARAPRGVLDKLVAYPLKSESDFFAVNWVRCSVHKPDKKSHVYRDAHLVDFTILASYRGVKGVHSTIEYIDVAMGQSIGRELWGYSKKAGSFGWQETSTGADLKCSSEDGTLLVESTISYRGEETSSPAAWPTALLRDYLDGPYLQVLISRRLGTNEPVRADVLRIDEKALSDGNSYPAASFREATGTLRLHDGPLDPLSILGPTEVVAVRASRNLTFDFPHGVPIGSADLRKRSG